MESIKDKKILVVDDHKELLKMIDEILRKEGFSRVFLASSYEEAVRVFRNVKPDCAILDVVLPDGDGFSIMRKIRETSKIPVIFLSARGEDEDRLIGLGLGADDYIVKPFLPKELTLRLVGILNRVYVPIEEEELPVFKLGDSVVVNLNSACVGKDGQEISLTAKEHSLLLKLYENKGRIVTNDSLCQAIWGDDMYGYENTLMVHVRRVREKIEKTPSTPKHLITVRGLGYKLMIN